jgi:hypothetical protein
MHHNARSGRGAWDSVGGACAAATGDYATKLAAISALEDHRTRRTTCSAGRCWNALAKTTTGEVTMVVVVSDKAPRFRAAAFAC